MNDLTPSMRAKVALLEAFDMDRADYRSFLIEYGFTETDVRAMVENTADQIHLPSVFDKLELRDSPIEGQGLFAKCSLEPSEVLALARTQSKRTAAGRYTNHSPRPNATFRLLDNNDIQMIASAPIAAGDEVTVDYRQAGQVNGSGAVRLAMQRQMVERLEVEMRKRPQIDAQLKHYFSRGVYARELTIPKGARLTGKIHKYEQINILSKGDISVLTEDGFVRVQAPFTIISPPGTKRIAIAHEECVWTTIHSTDGLKLSELDLDQIEEKFIAQSDAEYLEYERTLMLEGARS